jgi:hypothetical protein
LFNSFATSIPQAYWSLCISAYADIFHCWLCHPTSCVFNFIVSNNKLACNSRCSLFQCQACLLAKLSCLSLGPMGHKSFAPLELFFSDFWGPAFFFYGFCYFFQCVYKIYLVLSSCCEIWFIFYFSSFSSFCWALIFTKK